MVDIGKKKLLQSELSDYKNQLDDLMQWFKETSQYTDENYKQYIQERYYNNYEGFNDSMSQIILKNFERESEIENADENLSEFSLQCHDFCNTNEFPEKSLEPEDNVVSDKKKRKKKKRKQPKNKPPIGVEGANKQDTSSFTYNVYEVLKLKKKYYKLLKADTSNFPEDQNWQEPTITLSKQTEEKTAKKLEKTKKLQEKEACLNWLRSLSIEDRHKVICIENESWLCYLVLKMFWMNRSSNKNGFAQKPKETFENLLKFESKWQGIDELFSCQRIILEDEQTQAPLVIKNNYLLANEATKKQLHSIRFCSNLEPFNTITLANFAIENLEELIAIFEIISNEECFMSSIQDPKNLECNFFYAVTKKNNR